jgi:hypothetical protein
MALPPPAPESGNPPDLPRRGSGWPPWPWSAVGAILLAVWLYSPVTEVADVQLDSSNYASYAYFTGKHFQYGTEVLPMAGPYGFVPYGFHYAGQMFWKRFPLEILTKLVLGVLIIWFIRRTPARPVLGGLWLLSVLLFTPLITDLPYALAILLSGLCLVECHAATDRRSLIIATGLAAYLALLTLFKGTQSMLAFATLGLLVLQAVYLRNFRRLPWILGAYIMALIAWLLLAGQHPLNLPRYLVGMFEISSGYNLAMGVQEARATFVTGILAAIGLEVLLLMAVVALWRRPAALAGGLYLAGFTFVLWKHGFVRADGHVAIFYHYVCIAVPMGLLFAEGYDAWNTARWQRMLVRGVALLTLTFALWGEGEQAWLRYQSLPNRLPARVALSVDQILHPAQTKALLDAKLDERRTYFRLARVQAAVGESSIDFFGTEQAYLMLNRLNYRPRPVGGGPFSVFTPALQAYNARWLSNPANRPDFYLVNLLPIDDRLAAQEDAGTLRTLMTHYKPVEVVLGLPLFKAIADAPDVPHFRPLGSQPLAWGQPITLPAVGPGEMLFATLNLPPSLLGRLQVFLYKPPHVFMDLDGDGLESPRDRKIIPSMWQEPVPLHPLIESTDDLLHLYQSSDGKQVRQFTLKTAQPGFFDTQRMQLHFFAAPRPARQPAPAVSSQHPQISDIEPDFISATLAPVHRFEDLVAQVLVPPGRMGFVLRGDENAVDFLYGMVPETYLQPTDGADIWVEIERPDQSRQQLFKRLLKPRQQPADRGIQTKTLALPPAPPGSILWFCTGRGPDNDGAWDLAYFTQIKLRRGPYLPDHFPRFSRVPDLVEAGLNGRIPEGTRDVYLLNSPGRLTFNLQGHESKVRLGVGILPGAYQQGGNTDGVEFSLTLRSRDGREDTIFTRFLNPLEHHADRGDQTFLIELPAFPSGSQLILAAMPGPRGDQAWDWAYIESLAFP